MDTEIPEEIRDMIAQRVIEGFDSQDEIVNNALDWLAESYKLDLRVMQPLIRRDTAYRLEEQRLAEKEWIVPTDNDRLDLAFANLEDEGIVARQNFSCCPPCGFAEITDEIEAASKRRLIEGFAFYHLQTTEHATQGRGIHLYFGSWPREEEATLLIGWRIVKTLMCAGLSVGWNGTMDEVIRLTPFRWRKRRFTHP